MDLEALTALLLIIGFLFFLFGLGFVLGQPHGSVHRPDREDDTWGPDAHRSHRAW